LSHSFPLLSFCRMLFSSVFTILATMAMVSAQQGTVKTIQVGGNSTSPGGPIQFFPNTLDAPAGTIVSFQFSGVPGNHSVTQSSLGKPCEPLENGFDSGWIFVNESLPVVPEWNLTISNDSTPIWFYCKQLKGPGGAAHCNLEMVGVINLGQKPFSSFLASASAAPTVGQAEGGFSGVGAAATGAPFIPSGAQYFNPSATNTAPSSGGTDSAGNGTTGGGSGGKPPNSGLANGATPVVVLLATLFGMSLVF